MPEEQYGYEATGEFQPAFLAAMRRLRGGQARQRGELAQAVGAKQMRTSGVSMIPQETIERGGAEAEAGLIGGFAQRQAQQDIEDRIRKEEFERDLQRAESGMSMQEAMQRRLANQQLLAQLLGGSLAFAGGVAARRT